LLPIFYINLAHRNDRREYMDGQLESMGLAGTRIEAVTPADISAEDIEKYCSSARPVFLRENQLACTLSHERAWQAMLDGGHDMALILEDDAELSDLLTEFLLNAASVDADLIRIETTGLATRVFPISAELPGGIAIRPFRSTPLGSAGYVIKASAARKLLGNAGLRLRPIDLALYDPFQQPGSLLTRVLTEPAVCRQLGLADEATLGRSDIVHEAVSHEYAKQHPIRFAIASAWRDLTHGLRNVFDHLAQQSKGLERRVIVFGAADQI
jgi:glycosyl transferase family 25